MDIKNIQKVINETILEEYKNYNDKRYDYWTPNETEENEHKEKVLELYNNGCYIENGEKINSDELVNGFLQMTDTEAFYYTDITENFILDSTYFDQELQEDIEKVYNGVKIDEIITLIRLKKQISQNLDARAQGDNIDTEAINVIRDVLIRENEYRKNMWETKISKETTGLIGKKIEEKLGLDFEVNSDKDIHKYNFKDCLWGDISELGACIDVTEVRENRKEEYEKKLKFFSAKIAIRAMKPEEVTEEVMQILFDNNYKGEIPNPEILEKYQKFCKEQNQDKEVIIEKEENNEPVVDNKKDDKDGEIRKLKEQIEQYKKEIEEKDGIISQQKSQIEEQQTQLAENDTNNTKIEQLKNEIEMLKIENIEASVTIDKLKKRANSLQGNIGKLKEQIRSIKQCAKETEKKIKEEISSVKDLPVSNRWIERIKARFTKNREKEVINKVNKKAINGLNYIEIECNKMESSINNISMSTEEYLNAYKKGEKIPTKDDIVR